MKKFFIIAIVIVLAVTFALVAKEKGLLDALIGKVKDGVAEHAEKIAEKKKEIKPAIVDMDGFIISVVKKERVIASLETSFKVVVNEEIKPEIDMNRSLLRARMNSTIYDYIEKYYSDKMDLEKMKAYIISELKRFYGKDNIVDVLYAFYYIRPAG